MRRLLIVLSGLIVSAATLTAVPTVAGAQPPPERVSPSGLDLNWASDGYVELGFGDLTYGVTRVVSDGSDGLLAVRTASFGGASVVRSVAYDADGVVDAARGLASVELPITHTVTQVESDGSGGFFAMGTENDAGVRFLFIAKFDASGQLDAAYGDAGVRRFRFELTNAEMASYVNGNFTFIKSLSGYFTVLPSGEVAVAARFDPTFELRQEEWVFTVRLDPSGSLLTSAGSPLAGEVYGTPTATIINLADESGLNGPGAVGQSQDAVRSIVGLDDGTLFVIAYSTSSFTSYDHLLVRVSPTNVVTVAGPGWLRESGANLSLSALGTDGTSLFATGSRVAGSDRTAFMFRTGSNGVLDTSFGVAGKQSAVSVQPPNEITVTDDGTLLVAPALTSFGAGFERLSASGEPMAAWRTRAYHYTGLVPAGDTFLASGYDSPNSVIVKADAAGQIVGNTIELGFGELPPESATDCWVRTDDPEVIRCALNIYRLYYAPPAEFAGLEEAGSVSSQTSFQYGTLTFLSEQRCEPVWFKLRRYPWDGPFTSPCGMILAASGAPDDPAKPSTIDVQGSSYVEGLTVARNVDRGLSKTRVMFIDPAQPVGSYRNGVSWGDVFGRDVWEASQAQHRNIDHDPGVGEIRGGFADLAYERGGDGRPARYFESAPSFGNTQNLTALVKVATPFLPRDPDVVEADAVITWADQPGGTDGLWDASEPFDVDLNPVLHPLRLATLGDSYTAGEGATFSERNGCARSPWSYSGQMNQAELFEPVDNYFDYPYEIKTQVGQVDSNDLDRAGMGTEWLYLSCGGARSDSVIADQYSGVSDADGLRGLPGINGRETAEGNDSQLGNDLLESFEANIAVLTIGGNDVGFAKLLEGCLINTGWNGIKNVAFPVWGLFTDANCADVFKDLEWYGKPIEGRDGDFNPARLSGEEFLEQVLRRRLQATYEQMNQYLRVGAEGPEPEHVYIFGYPTLLGSGNCAETGLLGGSSRDFVNDLQPVMNAMIAEEAGNAGFTYVDPNAVFGDQGVCGNDLNGFVFNGGIGKPNDKSFHPTNDGYRSYVEAWLATNQSMFDQSGNRQPTGLPVRSEPGGGGGDTLRVAPLAAALLEEATTVFPSGEIEPNNESCGLPTYLAGSTIPVTGTGTAGDYLGVAFATSETDTNPTTADGQADASGAISFVVTVPATPGPYTVVTVAASGDKSIVRDATEISVVTGPVPCATPDQLQGAPGQAVSIDVVTNDTVPAGTAVEVAVTEAPAHGTATVSGTTITYIASDSFASLDQLTYQLCDTDGFCSEAFVEIDMTTGCTIMPVPGSLMLQGTTGDDVICGSVDDDQIIGGGGNDTVYTSGGADRVAGVLAGTVHAAPDTVAIEAAAGVQITGTDLTPTLIGSSYYALNDIIDTQSMTATVDLLANDIAGTQADPATITITYADTRLDINMAGAIATVTATEPVVGARFTYSACTSNGDCSGAVVSVTATGTGATPVANDDTTQTTQGTAIEIPVTGNDTDADGDLNPGSVELVTPPENGSAGPTSTPGSLLYTPAEDFDGIDTFEYRVCDLNGNCDTAIVTVTVTAVDGGNPPIANDDQAETEIGQATEIDVLDNDTDPDGDLDESSLTIVIPPVSGTATVTVDSGEASITYTPAAAFTGIDELTYRVCDDSGACDDAVVQITVYDPVLLCTITGTNGADVLTGTSGDDIICGRGGNDIIDGRGGDDIIYGGNGADTINGNGGDDIIYGGNGADTINGGADNDTINGGAGADTINGNNGDDQIRGNRGNDTINGGAGDDTLYTGRGKDVADGDAGNDTIYGRVGSDELNGSGGDDLIYGGRGQDTINGGAGNDELRGNRGADTMTGGAGNDIIYGGYGNDTLNGGNGPDILNGGRGADELRGGPEDDTLRGNNGADLLIGGDGYDSGYGGNGIDDCRVETSKSCP